MKQSIITIPETFTLYALQEHCLATGDEAIIDGDKGTARIFTASGGVLTVTIL